jgi:hypothetical protein
MSMYLIALSEGNDPQRDAVQAIVKAHAAVWWHELPDLWVVDGQNPQYWRDLIRPVLLLSSAAVIVFTLPDAQNGRAVAWTKLSRDQATWLFETYSGIPQPVEVPALAPGIPKAP